ncbi:MAG TPA: hypothetical protein VMB47_03985 [Candidatus Aquilonibacter sp.]|nr:hypothetical protein [Candidatus Aquilonibacter sp.]
MQPSTELSQFMGKDPYPAMKYVAYGCLVSGILLASVSVFLFVAGMVAFVALLFLHGKWKEQMRRALLVTQDKLVTDEAFRGRWQSWDVQERRQYLLDLSCNF